MELKDLLIQVLRNQLYELDMSRTILTKGSSRDLYSDLQRKSLELRIQQTRSLLHIIDPPTPSDYG